METPLVDLLVVQHNNLDLTIRMLNSAHADRVILVDNASSELFNWWSIKPIQVIQNSENVGYSRAVNQAIEKSTAPYLLFVNNDVVLERDTSEKLLAHLIAHPEVGAVSAQHATMNPSDTNVLSFACVMIRREAIQQVGLLDESFEYGVDDDYSIRLRAAGWKLAVADVHVYHEGAATWKAVKGDDWIKQNSEEALRRLKEKHG